MDSIPTKKSNSYGLPGKAGGSPFVIVGRAEGKNMQRFFYHSFPRRGKVAGNPNQLGLTILSSICRNGLLLVPELVSWADPTQLDASSRVSGIQRRICFTELAPAELYAHAQVFGSFALEFSTETLRALGAMPTIYIPDAVGAGGLSSIGASLVSHHAGAFSLFSSITRTLELTGQTLELKVTMKDTGKTTVREFDTFETSAIREYLFSLAQTEGLPFVEMTEALRAMGGLFYPTENNKYNEELAYYRQREWRLMQGPFVNGQPTTNVATAAQAAELLAIDQAFFSKTLNFADGATASLAERSHFLTRIFDKPVMDFVNRVLVPMSALADSIKILQQNGLRVPIVPLLPNFAVGNGYAEVRYQPL